MTIFVHMAAYRDPECEPTIRDLFAKAARPTEIRVGLLLHAAPEDGPAFRHEGVTILRLDYRESLGCSRSRAQGYALFGGEDHILQIDSHTRFAQNWDDKLLRQLAACAAPKALLTAYCNGYEPPDLLDGANPPYLAAKEFEPSGFLSQHGLLTDLSPAKPKRTAFASAHFLFGPSQWIREVPYDPWLYFFGEEITLAVRLWTSGWDLFGPTESLIWHRFNRAGRPLHWNDKPEWGGLNERSHQRMRHLFGMEGAPPDALRDIDRFGLGSARTLQDYQRFSGIDFARRTIAPHALSGDFGDLTVSRGFRRPACPLARAWRARFPQSAAPDPA